MNCFLSGLLDCRESQVYNELDRLLEQIIARKRLREYEMSANEIQDFAKSVEESQQRLLNQSYVKLNVDQIEKIYRILY